MNAPEWMDINSGMSHCQDGAILVCSEGSPRVAYVHLDEQYRQELPLMPAHVFESGVLKTSEFFYVIGGYRVKSDGESTIEVSYKGVHRLALGQMEWEKIRSLRFAVSFPMIVVNRNVIYTIGGIKSRRKVNYVQTLNLDTPASEWHVLEPLPYSCGCHVAGAVVYNNNIVVLTTEHCMTYYQDKDKWEAQSYRKLGDAVKVILYQGEIIGYIKRGDVFTIQKYDYADNRWSGDINVPINWHATYLFTACAQTLKPQ